MDEITVKFELPHELKDVFKSELAKALKNLVIDLEFSMADSILSESKLTNEQVKQLSEEIDKRASKELVS